MYALVGAVLAFFGFINGTALGFGNSSPVALGYLIIAGVCLAFGRQHLPQTIGMIEHPGAEHAAAEGED